MNTILKDLFNGRISGWERRIERTAEEEEINEKIRAEKKHFAQMMSEEDKKRLENFENLYSQAHAIDDLHSFIYGFRLGALILCAVFMEKEGS